jgi:bifunctional DNA-binding transcriptional regulator/antitoxin component of YhaV-PrlF toxin-antitoxin module
MYPYLMRKSMTVSVTWRGQAVLPLEWRKANGLEEGGPCDARFVEDGKGSLLLTPRPKRKGAKGLLKFLSKQTAALPPVRRHLLPSK